PIGTVRVGIMGDSETKEVVINPHAAESQFLDLDMIVSSSVKGNVIMIESGAREIKEDIALEAIKKAKEANEQIIGFIQELVKEIGQPKVAVSKDEGLEEAVMLVEKSYKDKIEKIVEEGVNKEVG